MDDERFGEHQWTSMEVAARALYELDAGVRGDEDPLLDWRRLTTSDHVCSMCTEWLADGDLRRDSTPLESPYEGYVSAAAGTQEAASG